MLARPLDRFLEDGHESIGITKGRRLDQHGMDDREDGGVGANAQRQRQHHRCREPRRAAQRAQCVLDVAADIVEPGKRARIALAVLHLLYAAERTSGRDARIGRAHAAAPIVVFQQRQVCRGLARQIGLGPVRPEDID